jgi:hypothetical protein
MHRQPESGSTCSWCISRCQRGELQAARSDAVRSFKTVAAPPARGVVTARNSEIGMLVSAAIRTATIRRVGLAMFLSRSRRI